MTDLATERIEYGRDDRRWIRSHVGFRDTLGVTLDGSLFDAARFPDGVVPSGTVIAAVTPPAGQVTPLFGPYDPAATDGRQSLGSSRVFFLLETQIVRPMHRKSCAGLDFGRVNTRYLPQPPTGVTGPAAAVGVVDNAVREALPRVGWMDGVNP